jgi:hypothetical protein
VAPSFRVAEEEQVDPRGPGAEPAPASDGAAAAHRIRHVGASAALLVLLLDSARAGPTGPLARPPAPQGPAGALDNAWLLMARPRRRPTPSSRARHELSALRPSFVRLLISWAALQPRRAPTRPLRESTAGRQTGPCRAYAGVRAGWPRSPHGSAPPRQAGAPSRCWSHIGTPAWAAPPSGCDLPGTASTARAPRGAIADCRARASLVALPLAGGPLVEPVERAQQPRFLGQHAAEAGSARSRRPPTPSSRGRWPPSCTGGTRRGARAGNSPASGDSPHATSISSFLGAPAEVLCRVGLVGPPYASCRRSQPRPTCGGDAGSSTPRRLRGARPCGSPGGAGARAGRAAPLRPARRGRGAAPRLPLQRWSADPALGPSFIQLPPGPRLPGPASSAPTCATCIRLRLWLSFSQRRERAASPRPAGHGLRAIGSAQRLALPPVA